MTATPAPATIRHPTWSPDSEQIAFASDRGGSFEIWSIRISDGEPVSLTNLGVHSSCPAWSPDGQQIVFVSNLDGDFDLYLLALASGHVTQLLDLPGRDWRPAWSPDGSRIAFTSDRDGDLEICLVSSDGLGLTQLTSNDVHDADPTWWPDGTQIVASSGGQLVRIDVASGAAEPITEADYQYRFPSLSPDGSRLVYTRPRWKGGQPEIYARSLDSGESRQLVGYVAWDPVWSPDGNWIAFSQFWSDDWGDDELSGIRVIRPDATDELGRGIVWEPRTKHWLEEPDWWLSLSLFMPGSGFVRLAQLGVTPFATDNLDGPLNELEYPPMPGPEFSGSGFSEIRFSEDGVFGAKLDLRSSARRAATWRIALRANTQPYRLAWEAHDLPDDVRLTLRDPYLKGKILEVDILSQSEIAITEDALTILDIAYRRQTEHTLELTEGWNLVSLPVETADSDLHSVLPGAISAFRHTGTRYQQVEQIRPCEGYFVNMAAAASVTVRGLAQSECECDLGQGWSLVGAPMDPLAVGQIGQRPEQILVSVFGLTEMYQPVSELEPGRGYWANLQAPGSLSLSVPGGNLKAAGEQPPTRGRGALWIERKASRQSIDLDVAPGSVLREPPPLPPGDIPDIRIMTQAGPVAQVVRAESPQEYPIRIQGRSLVLGWDVSATTARWELLADGEWTALDGRGEVTMGDAWPPVTVRLRRSPLPSTVVLHPTYPNPFNPSTTIRYDLSQSTPVKLKIYDVAGRLVLEFDEGVQPPGSYQRVWEGRDRAGRAVAAGTYFCELVAGDERRVQRTLLMK